jgi:hypothetical protein
VFRILPIAAFSLFAFASASSADIIKLKNGETISGLVVSKDNHYVTVKVAGGEIGFDESLVDSIDSAAGPKTNDDIAALTDASRKRAADQDAERAMAVARREAAVAAEAAAQRNGATATDAAASLTTEERVDNAEQALTIRIDAIDEALAQIPTRREREKMRRAIVAYYFGASGFDPILGVVR